MRYLADQNKVLGIYESGTYAAELVGSSFWIGQVTDHSIDDTENLLINRFLGTADRNFDAVEQGPRDVTGTLTYHPQDMRLIFYAIGSFGSVSGCSGVNAAHSVKEINSDVMQSSFTSGAGILNAPMSFTIQDSKQAPGTAKNFVRTIYGVVPNVTTLTATQGEKVVVTMDYIGQTLITRTGSTTALTEDTTRPFLWSDVTFQIWRGVSTNGSVLDTTKEVSFEINQNRTAPHYLNGSRDIAAPYNGNRDYTISVTLDLDSDDADMLYNTFYKSGNDFNAQLDLNADVVATGSKHATFIFSGCYIASMENPSVTEGLTETTIEIRPETVTGSTWDTGTESGLYGPY